MYRNEMEVLEAIRDYVLQSAHVPRPELEVALAREFNMNPDEVVAWLLRLEREQGVTVDARGETGDRRGAKPNKTKTRTLSRPRDRRGRHERERYRISEPMACRQVTLP